MAKLLASNQKLWVRLPSLAQIYEHLIMQIFLLSDTHFNHANIIKLGYRPHNFEELVVKHLTTMLNTGDILIHLGDICLGHDEEVNNKLIALTAHLHSRILVIGNHDSKSNTWYFNHGWEFVCKSFSAKYFGKKILFSHKPQIPEDKYDINIHGHSHGNLHRADEYCDFFDPNYHKEVCLEHSNYKPILLKTFLGGIA